MSIVTETAVAVEIIEACQEPKPIPFDLIIAASYRYVGAFVQDRWGKYGKVGRALRFSDSALVRVGQIFGWIHGVSFHDKPLAEALASDFIGRMDRLSEYGGEFGDRPEEEASQPNLWSFHVPRYLIQLGDDGCFGSFTIAWHCGVPKDQAEKAAEPKSGWIKDDRHGWAPYYWYTFSFNGGLIFHGPDDLSNLKPERCYWSTHT